MRSTSCQSFWALTCVQYIACISGIVSGLAGLYFLNASFVQDLGKAAVYMVAEIISVLGFFLVIYMIALFIHLCITILKCCAIEFECVTPKLAIDDSHADV